MADLLAQWMCALTCRECSSDDRYAAKRALRTPDRYAYLYRPTCLHRGRSFSASGVGHAGPMGQRRAALRIIAGTA